VVAEIDAFEQHETFRNELASVAPDGRRRWIYARQPAGRFYRARTIVSVFLLTFLFAAPFVHINGLPLVLLNVIERRFVLFGLIFWPQDFYLVVLIAIAVLVTLVLSTATIGRVWCGWLCPQTVFMEMLFRRIEFLIEGSAAQQMRRDRGPWTADRVWRAAIKQGVFFGLSFVIANVFLAYIVGAEALRAIVTAPPREHLVGLVAIVLFSAVFYAVFARFREQACVLACPYGRVMSSLIDRHTITVTYDTGRGEPRGRLVGGTTPPTDARRGDCVDCFQCVTVCPTGIDIRNGVQLECVNCTACADACDDVMQRLRRPRGLIRLTSHEAVSQETGGRLHWLTPRIAAYATVWLVLVIVVAALVADRPDLDILILRQAGALFGAESDGQIVNLYTVQVFNRAASMRDLAIAVRSPDGAKVTLLGPLARIGPYALQEGRVLVSVPQASLSGPVTPLRFEVRADGGPPRSIESSLVGPVRMGAPQAHEESR
jgi:cytochrome c oxidase accessory protein FixG